MVLSIFEILESPRFYSAWQYFFRQAKVRTFAEKNLISSSDHVLDLGCGPGTNRGLFLQAAHYVGVDISERYLMQARRRFTGDFVCADLSQGVPASLGNFDIIFINSFLHHLSRGNVKKLLTTCKSALKPSGKLYIIDAILSESRWSVAYCLARLDRGKYIRPFNELSDLIADNFSQTSIGQFKIRMGFLTLWNMVSIEAIPRSDI